MPRLNTRVTESEVEDSLHKATEVNRLCAPLDNAVEDLCSFIRDMYPLDFELLRRVEKVEESKANIKTTFKMLYYSLLYLFTVKRR